MKVFNNSLFIDCIIPPLLDCIPQIAVIVYNLLLIEFRESGSHLLSKPIGM